jgi:opacity protein-like surface antigen
MKKLLFILLIINTCALYAQKGTYIRFEGGLSVPSLDLSSTKWDTSSKTGGFAKFGYNYGLDISWYFKYNFGVSFSYYQNRHKLRNEDIYEKAFQQGIDSIITIESNPWVMNHLLLGINYQFYSTEKFRIEAILRAGRLSTFAPRIKLRATDLNGMISTFERKAAGASAFSIGAGIGCKYQINDNTLLTLYLNYLYGSPEFTFKETIEVRDHLGVLNTSVGLAYKF